MTTRHEFLAMLHERLKPRGYLEIGVFSGDSLRLVQPGKPAIGIDPDPHLHGHFPGTTQVYRMTSDHFFGPPLRAEDDGHGQYVLDNLDLAFIDGMHLFEFALRDFMHLEEFCTSDSVILLHDCYPGNAKIGARKAITDWWAGDVWKLVVCLKEYRPDLRISVVDVPPTGLGILTGLNPASRVLKDHYEEICGRFLTMDYSAVADGKEQKLNRVANDWEVVQRLLPQPQR